MSALTASDLQPPPQLEGDPGPFRASFTLTATEGNRRTYTFRMTADEATTPPQLFLRWTLPATNIKGVWTSGSLYEKRLRADWEPADMTSRLSVNAPVISLFGHQDENRLTFAWSDAVNAVRLAAPVREEDNLIHCRVELFPEGCEPLKEYEAQLLVDSSECLYDEALHHVGHWWETGRPEGWAIPTPLAASNAIYSTWYSYHQEITTSGLLEECRLARALCYGTIIVDDGWQTMDNQRGYDYTGDWAPDRFPDMRSFVNDVHALGMKAMLWYSVPFCGPKSQAYQRFSGKFLTENHRWAPVFDPRYPEVREHLVGKYVQAVTEWDYDGLKLDFIDDFKVYPETPTGMANGRDYADVNAAVSRLIDDIRTALDAARPGVLIEFRQQYIGPGLRRLGNLFRAFDCPNDSATNRLRTTDVRLIGGSSIVTADMTTWHPDESVELAALQLTNTLFSVLQLSVRLAEQPADKTEMIRFWTTYYNENQRLLLRGNLRASSPLENYPLLSVRDGGKMIVGLYGSSLVRIPSGINQLDLINGRVDEDVVLLIEDGAAPLKAESFDCRGRSVGITPLKPGCQLIKAPVCGLLLITKP